MSGTTIVDAVLDFLNIEVIDMSEEELSGIGDISTEAYNELIQLVEQLIKEE